MDKILEHMCVNVEHHKICNVDLMNLFHGKPVQMHDGHTFLAEFPTAKTHDKFSRLCRHHEGFDICLENIVDLYKQPHDCIMFADEWIC
mmetsp:Transcript_23665/g.29308  ORF Transcript_23665/g.29308 Transcript_23665/m.29308 type:complete len:89 (+) Transcript_23665:1105-1371(+)